MTNPVFMGDGSRVRGRDSNFTETINQRMQVPDHLSVGPGPQDDGRRRPEDPPPAYSMHIPDRLALTDTPDLSPRPMFSKQSSTGHVGSMWDLQDGSWGRDAFMREPMQSPLRRSYSDTAFGKNPPGTPTYPKQVLHTPSSRSAGRPAPHADLPLPMPLGLPAIPPSLLTPQAMLQAAKDLGQHASQRILQTVTQKYSSRFGLWSPAQVVEADAAVHNRKSGMQEPWFSPGEDSGAAVEFIVLRRQVVKMSRRLAGLERQNAERRQTELVLFSLLLSACLINGWLWMRR